MKTGKMSIIYPPTGIRAVESSQPGKLTVIYNSVPERTHNIGDVPAIDKSKLNVVYVGRVCADKGVRELIDVAMQVASERDDIDFHLLGDYKWRNPFAEEIIEEVNSKGFAGRIHFHGELNDVTDFLSQCDLHVCPSVWDEPFGIVVIEAKSESLPSVVFPSGGLKETVRHLVDGYICTDRTSAALYEGLTYFIERPQAMKTAGEAARRSLDNFSSAKITEAWCKIYKCPNPR
jgi:glycosyltransferase involved in cell wall biosynthesis